MLKQQLGYGVTAWARGAALGHMDGIGVYTQALHEALLTEPNHTLQVNPYMFGDYSGSLSCGKPNILARRVSHHLAKAALFRSRLTCKADLFHATDHYIPLLDIPVVATVMDLIPFLHPEWVSQGLRSLKNWLFKRSILSANHIITISEHSRQDLIKQFHVPEKNISVTPLGVDAHYFTVVSCEDRKRVLNAYQLSPGFFLFIGTLQPRKNIDTILNAHALLPVSLRKRHPMVIIGRDGWGVEPLIHRIRQLEQEGTVRWLDYVPKADVMALLQSACGLTFVSLYEGFGLPILEAFAANCPVIASNTTSIPEVAGDAAILVNPLDDMALSQAMMQLTEDENLILTLKEKGKIRAATYTWNACAKATLMAYRTALSV